MGEGAFFIPLLYANSALRPKNKKIFIFLTYLIDDIII